MVSYEKDQATHTAPGRTNMATGRRIFILMEGWMVPLVDFLSYLKDLRAILPNNAIDSAWGWLADRIQPPLPL